MPNKNFLFVRQKQELVKVGYSVIHYVRAEGNYCFLHTADDNVYTVKLSLRQLIQQVDNVQFVRIHKSYIINIAWLDRVQMKERTVTVAGTTLPFGRTFIKDLTTQLVIL